MKRLILSLTLSLFSTFGLALAADVQGSLYNFQLKMAERGSAEAAFTLGQMNEEGRGTPRDLQKALEWYMQAAAKGQPEAADRIEELKARTGTN